MFRCPTTSEASPGFALPVNTIKLSYAIAMLSCRKIAMISRRLKEQHAAQAACGTESDAASVACYCLSHASPRGMAGEVGFEPTHDGIKIRCLNQLGHSPIKCPHDQPSGTRTTQLQQYEHGSHFTDFSLPATETRRLIHVRRILKTCIHSATNDIESVFHYRTPESETLLDRFGI
jgi:hypothetical protein